MYYELLSYSNDFFAFTNRVTQLSNAAPVGVVWKPSLRLHACRIERQFIISQNEQSCFTFAI